MSDKIICEYIDEKMDEINDKLDAIMGHLKIDVLDTDNTSDVDFEEEMDTDEGGM